MTMTEQPSAYAVNDALAREHGLVVNAAGVVVGTCDPGEDRDVAHEVRDGERDARQRLPEIDALRELEAMTTSVINNLWEDKRALKEELQKTRDKLNLAERDLRDYKCRVQLARIISGDWYPTDLESVSDTVDRQGIGELQLVLQGGKPDCYCESCPEHRAYPIFWTPTSHPKTCRFCDPPHMEPDTREEDR